MSGWGERVIKQKHINVTNYNQTLITWPNKITLTLSLATELNKHKPTQTVTTQVVKTYNRGFDLPSQLTTLVLPSVSEFTANHDAKRIGGVR